MAEDASSLLRSMQNADGGFPPAAGGVSEPEPTALAAVALDDGDARGWLVAHQASDGGFITGPPALLNDSATPLAALALEPGDPRDRATSYVIDHQAQAIDRDERFPHDPDTRAWGWTSRTFGWVEPTSRALHALKVLAPLRAASVIADGRAVLADRECVGGGWNYGNRQVLGTDLEPFLQTTAAAIIALHDETSELRARGLSIIESLWPDERGGLSWSMSLVALRLAGRSGDDLARALAEYVAATGLYGDTVSLGWAAIGLGPGLERLRVSE